MNPRKIINQRWFYIPFLAWAGYLLLPECHSWWMDRTETFRGTVLGTFSGIFVGLVGFLVSKHHETRLKRYNALCYIEQILHCLLVSVNDNQWQIEKALATDEITLIFPSELKMSEQDFREISRIDLKNKLLGVYIDCVKYGQSLAHAIKIFEMNVDTFKAFGAERVGGRQDMVQAILRDFYRQLKIKLKELYEFGEVVEQDIEKVLVDVRFFARNDRPWLTSANPYYDKHDLERWRARDIKRLQKEREDTAAADDARRKELAARKDHQPNEQPEHNLADASESTSASGAPRREGLSMERIRGIMRRLWFLGFCSAGLVFVGIWWKVAGFASPLAGGLLLALFGTLLLMSIWFRWLPRDFLPTFTALLTAAATITIAIMAREQARISVEQTRIGSQQATISAGMLEEMKMAREQQQQPYVQVWLEPSVNDDRYMVTVKNLGGGVAKSVELKYKYEDLEHGYSYKVLGPDQETTTPTLIPLGALSQAGMEFQVSYGDGFGNEFNEPVTFGSQDRGVPKSQYSMWRDSVKRSQQENKEQLLVVQQLINALQGKDANPLSNRRD